MGFSILMNEDLGSAPPDGSDPRIGSRRDRRAGPLRRCIASRTERPKDEMMRFSVAPDGALVPDVDGRLPGRGLWLLADRDMLNKACKKGLFAKAARTSVNIPDNLAGQIERQLTRRCLDRIGLARRAGRAVAGYEKVRALLRGGKVGVLLQANDGAEGGRSKIQALDPGVPLIDLFAAAELGAAVGREFAVHLALERGRLAEELIRDANRLQGFLGPGAAQVSDPDLERPSH